MLTEKEFIEQWRSITKPNTFGQFLDWIIRSEALEIQDLEINTPRGLKIMSDLHEANLRMKYYDLLNFKFKEFVDANVSQGSSFSILEIEDFRNDV